MLILFTGVRFMRGYPLYGAIGFGALVLIGCWRARRSPGRVGAALWVIASAAAAFAAGQLFVAPNARPSLHNVQPGAEQVFGTVAGFPAPSGTAAMAGAVAAGMFFVNRGLGFAAAAMAAATAAFQVCLVAYSWQDVAAGIIFGIAIVLGGYALFENALTRLGHRVTRAGGSVTRMRRDLVWRR
jgi:hypothetical protein